MHYRISIEAEEDLIRIFRYGSEKFGEAQAIKYYLGMIENFQRIADNPYSFPSAELIKTGYRYCTYKADTIYYRITYEVEIMAIIGRQNFILND